MLTFINGTVRKNHYEKHNTTQKKNNIKQSTNPWDTN